MVTERIRIAADYQRRPNKGGLPEGVKMVRWPLRVKTVLQLWAVEFIAEKDEQRFIHSPNIAKWSLPNFLPFLNVLRSVDPEFYEKLRGVSKDDKHMAFKALQRHHKMFYRLKRGRQYSEEHPDNQAAKSPKHSAEVNSGRMAYMKWRGTNV